MWCVEEVINNTDLKFSWNFPLIFVTSPVISFSHGLVFTDYTISKTNHRGFRVSTRYSLYCDAFSAHITGE